jgi:transcription elongation factor Elf1
MHISRERAERIARAHACVRCGEYNWRKFSVKEASAEHREELGEEWHAVLVCGVCGLQQELGLDGEGEVVYVT